MKTKYLSSTAAFLAVALLSTSCKLVGPDHSVPDSESAASFKNASSEFSSRLSKRWWRIFGDGKLNSLMADLGGVDRVGCFISPFHFPDKTKEMPIASERLL